MISRLIGNLVFIIFYFNFRNLIGSYAKMFTQKEIEKDALHEGRLTKPVLMEFANDTDGCNTPPPSQISRLKKFPNDILVGKGGKDLRLFFGVSNDSCLTYVFGRRGQQLINMQVLEEPTDDDFDDILEVSLGYFNSHFNPVRIFWQGHDGTRKSVERMKNLERYELDWMDSFIGDEMYVIDLDENIEIHRHVVLGDGVEHIVPFNGYDEERCTFEWDRHLFDCELAPEPDWQHIWEVRNASLNEVRQNNREQPSTVPFFTDSGYAKRKVPEDVWEVIMEFYHGNKHNLVKEEWEEDNAVTNHREAPSYMIHLPETGRVKPSIYEGLKPLLAEWSGVKDLEATACYGIRIYTNNSILTGHVDTVATHAISAIINVDQDVEEDWPLEIFNHNGVPTNVTMKPGELVLYESASCEHGRPYPLKGKHFTNMFVHFRPKNRKLWVH